MPRSRLLVTLALVLVGLASSRAASAFCRTTTCDKCTAVAGACVTEGHPLFWPVTCINYDVQQRASTQADLDQVTAIADAAFETWASVTCPNGLPPSFTVRNLQPVACDKHEYNDQDKSFGGNANILIFRTGQWSEAQVTQTLALTTVTFNVNSGEIYDADIEVSDDNPISVETPVLGGKYDLQSILTHEVGHFLGLAHSQACDAPDGRGCPTMDPVYRQGSDDFRSLEADDVAGICTIYPADRNATDNSCRPRHGFSSDCGSTGDSKGCCTTAPGGTSHGAVGALCASLLGLAAWVSRRRQT
ncbi:MAG TPA: matrixin family metalloprotease [Polyangiaceae bacterium]|nr:matrixin family metalloprotease [Polyangiaceae bacterium]